jgi:hypothetical protein
MVGVETVRVVAIAVALLAAGCNAGAGGSDREGAGSRMDSVLVVPEGAELVGTVFPAAEEGNWDAVLLVTGDDPLAVLRDLVDQTDDAGYDVSTLRSDGAACDVFLGAALECRAYASRQGAPESYEFSLRWGNLDGASFRHVLVRRDSESIWFEPNLTSVESDLPAPPEPVDDWEAPEVGDPVAAPPEAFGETVVELEAGGRMLGPATHSWSATSGFNVVVALNDDVTVDQVVAAYAAQFEHRGFEGEISESSFEGRSAVSARYRQAGGGEIEAVAVAGSEEGSWFVLLSRAGD